MTENRLGRIPDTQKQHYKMYKAGKQWLFAGLTLLTFGLVEAMTQDDVHADQTPTTVQTQAGSASATNTISAGSAVLSTATSQTQTTSQASAQSEQSGSQTSVATSVSSETAKSDATASLNRVKRPTQN